MTQSEKEAFVTTWASHRKPKPKEPLTVATFQMKHYLAEKRAEERVRNGSRGSIRLETEHLEYLTSETVIVLTLTNGRLAEAMYRFDKDNGKIIVR